VTSIAERTLTLEAPQIEGVPVSGQQTYTLPDDAGFYFLGRKLTPEELPTYLKAGALIRVYPPRPQTLQVAGS